MKKGAPIQSLLSEGVGEVGGAVSVLKGAPHPNVALLWARWAVSDEGQRVYAQAGETPAHPNVEPLEKVRPAAAYMLTIDDVKEFPKYEKALEGNLSAPLKRSVTTGNETGSDGRIIALGPGTFLPFSCADACNRLDLDEDVRRRQAADLYERGARKITGKKLLPRAPYFGVLFNVDDIDRHLYDVRHGSAGGLNEMTNFPEDDFRLFVLIGSLDRDSIRSARNRAGDKQYVADTERVGPTSRRRFGNVRAGNSFDIHRQLLHPSGLVSSISDKGAIALVLRKSSRSSSSGYFTKPVEEPGIERGAVARLCA